MNKEQFVSALHKKLQVIEANERQDIIDEYINHIDMKMQEGKSEEEAIEDFGDIDELVKDILDAYKINTNNQKVDYDEKLDHFLENIFEKFKEFISSFTSLDMDDVVKFIFELFVILIFLFILRIPFEIIESLGASLLRNIIGFGVGSVLATIWTIIISLAYVVVFVVVLVSACHKRIQRYRTNDTSDFMKDLKESLRFEKKEHSNEEKAAYTSNKQDHPYTEEKSEYASSKKENPYGNQGKKEYAQNSGSIISMILKVFSIFLFIPFIGVMVGLCVALGILISLSIQGVYSIGGFFILIGCIVGTSAFISLIYRSIWKGGSF